MIKVNVKIKNDKYLGIKRVLVLGTRKITCWVIFQSILSSKICELIIDWLHLQTEQS
jgi:hypothetical protein